MILDVLIPVDLIKLEYQYDLELIINKDISNTHLGKMPEWQNRLLKIFFRKVGNFHVTRWCLLLLFDHGGINMSNYNLNKFLSVYV